MTRTFSSQNITGPQSVSLPKDFFVGFMLQFHWLVCRGMRLCLPALKQDQRKIANFSIVCPTFHVDSVGHFLRVHTIG